MGWCLLCGVLVAACVAAAVRRRSGSARKRALVQLCADAGIVYSVVDPSDTTLLPFRVFASQSAHGVENVVSDEHDGRGIRVFDLWVQTRPDEARRTMTWTMTCAVVPLPFSVRRIDVVPSGQIDPSAESVAAEIVHLELDTFEQRFEVRATDPRAAVALLDQRMMATLLRVPVRCCAPTRSTG